MKNQTGVILVVTLLFLFVLTLLVMDATQEMILEYKMQAAMDLREHIFKRAQAGIVQMEWMLRHQDFPLPNSPIALQTKYNLEKTDVCSNPIVSMQSVATHQHQQVILNVRDIFAKVPVQKNCKPIPPCQRLTWQEQ